MKKINLLWLAAVLALVVALAGCKDDSDDVSGGGGGGDSGGGGGSGGGSASLTLPVPVPPAEIQNYTEATLTTASDANLLIRYACCSAYGSPFIEMLEAAKLDVIIAAMLEEYGDEFNLMEAVEGETSYTLTLPIDDSEILKDAAGVNAATIKGNINMSMSSSVPFGSETPRAPGDTLSQTQSSEITYNISDGFYMYTDYDDITYKIAGVITAQIEGSYTSTCIAVETETAPEKNNIDISSTIKITATLTISDGTNGGKFVFSYASAQSNKERSITEKSEKIISDVEVYDNAGNKIITVEKGTNFLDGEDVINALIFAFGM